LAESTGKGYELPCNVPSCLSGILFYVPSQHFTDMTSDVSRDFSLKAKDLQKSKARIKDFGPRPRSVSIQYSVLDM